MTEIKRPKPGDRLKKLLSMRERIHEVAHTQALQMDEAGASRFAEAISDIVDEIKLDPDMLGILEMLEATEAQHQNAGDYEQQMANFFFMAADDIRETFAQQMRANGVTVFVGSTMTASIVMGDPIMKVDVNALPPEYTRLMPTIDKAKIKEALKSGITIPGITLEEDPMLQVTILKKGVPHGTSPTTESATA